jgi:hypothetical protein
MTDYLSLRISAVSARCKFGAMIQDWYRHNGWQHWTLASWAESAGFHAIPYGRMTDIFGGTSGELSRQDFESLAEANRRLAAKDYGQLPGCGGHQQCRATAPRERSAMDCF